MFDVLWSWLTPCVHYLQDVPYVVFLTHTMGALSRACSMCCDPDSHRAYIIYSVFQVLWYWLTPWVHYLQHVPCAVFLTHTMGALSTACSMWCIPDSHRGCIIYRIFHVLCSWLTPCVCFLQHVPSAVFLTHNVGALSTACSKCCDTDSHRGCIIYSLFHVLYSWLTQCVHYLQDIPCAVYLTHTVDALCTACFLCTPDSPDCSVYLEQW